MCLAGGELTGNDMDFCEPVRAMTRSTFRLDQPLSVGRSLEILGLGQRSPSCVRLGSRMPMAVQTCIAILMENGAGLLVTYPAKDRLVQIRILSRPKNVTGRMFQISTNVSFICMAGYELVGQASITCRENGRWSHPSPQCK